MKTVIREIVFSIWLLAGLVVLSLRMQSIGETILDAAMSWRFKNNGHG